MEILKIGALIALVLLPLVYLGWIVYVLKKDSLNIRYVWSELENFDKYSVKAGLLMIIPVPALKSSPYHEEYIPALAIELLPAIATGFLVNGIISYTKAMHRHRGGTT